MKKARPNTIYCRTVHLQWVSDPEFGANDDEGLPAFGGTGVGDRESAVKVGLNLLGNQ